MNRTLFDTEQQASEYFEEKTDDAVNFPPGDAFSFTSSDGAKCVQCGRNFQRQPRSKSAACSDECRRARRLAYGASYRAEGREMAAKIRARFGPDGPTKEDFERLARSANIKQTRKDRP
ncbi:MAG: hypothetical protein QE284_04985 [Rhizobium sp.]|nr:hypothetical protein [Rhizobium sp.]